MAITITTQPKKYSGAKNPMALVVETDNYVQTAGTSQVVDVEDNLAVNDGDSIQLTIGSTSLTITFKTTPDLEKMEVKTYFGGGAADYNEMISNLNQLPVLGELFTITGVWGAYPQHIIFTQKEASTANELTIVSWPFHNKTVTDAVNTVYRNNYKGIVNIYAQGTEQGIRETTTLLQQLEATPDQDNEMTFELQNAFKGHLKADVPSSATDNGMAVLCPNAYTHYWVEIGEKYGDNNTYYPLSMIGKAANYKGAILGGMKWEQWDDDTVNDEYFANATNRWLTNMPAEKRVKTTEPLWLHAFVNVHNTGVQLMVDVFFSDGTDDGFTQVGSIGTVEGVYRWAVGYTQLNIPGNVTIPAGEVVTHYTVSVLNGTGTVITETYEIKLDHSYSDDKYIIFKNMWGYMDTLCARGEYTRGISAESIDAVAVELPVYSSTDGPLQQYATKSRETIVWNTGFLTAAEIEWLKELAESDEVYIVEGTKLIRVTVDRGSFATLYSDTVPLNGLNIAMMKANYR